MRESARRPVLLLCEDLHWIDTETQTFLDEVVASLPTARLLAGGHLPARVRATAGPTSRSARQFRVEALPAETTDELLETLLGPDPGLRPLKRLLVQLTDRNPFFLEETVRTLSEVGVLAGSPAPTGRRGSSRRSRSRTPSRRSWPPASTGCRTAPSACSSRPRWWAPTSPWSCSRRSRTRATPTSGPARRAAGRRVPLRVAALPRLRVHLPPRAHPRRRLRQPLAGAPARAARAHRRRDRAAAAEAADRGRRPARAPHLPGEVWDRAVRYSRQAGAKAQQRSAHREAVAWLEQALTALGHLPAEADARGRRSTCVSSCAGRLLHRRTREDARPPPRGGDPGRPAGRRAATGMGVDAPRRVQPSDRALPRGVGPDPEGPRDRRHDRRYAPAAGVRSVPRHGLHALGDYRRAAEHERRAAEFPRDEPAPGGFGPTQAGSPAGFRAVSLGWLARCLAEIGEFDEGIALGREAVRLAEEIHRPYTLVSACWGLGYLHGVRGDLDAATLLLDRALTAARAPG